MGTTEPPGSTSGPRGAYAPKLGDRSLFPDLEPRAYLNHAAIAPPSRPVQEAARTIIEDYARRGAAAFLRWRDSRERLRGRLAALIGAASTDIGFAPNTSRGVSDVALCLPWRPGDRIVCFEGEFPANVTPWQQAAALFGLEVVFLPLADYDEDDTTGLARLAATLAEGRVRLVAVSAVQFRTGLRMPMAAMSALCHEAGAWLFVDAIQACGAVPLDVGALGIDLLAAGSHKWLMGLDGAGFVYVSPAIVGSLRPAVAGWLSHEDPVAFLLEGPGRLRHDRPIRARTDLIEGGTQNGVGLAALEASVEILMALGVPAIHTHVNRYLDLLEAGLLARGFRSLRSPDPARRSCILSVLPPGGRSSVALAAALRAHGIACSTPDGLLRFSPGWPNGLDELPEVLVAVGDSLE